MLDRWWLPTLCLSLSLTSVGCGLTYDLDPPDAPPDASSFDSATEDSDTSTPECVHDGDCGDGITCNGIERCVAGACVHAPDPCTSMGCIVRMCDPVMDLCVESEVCPPNSYCTSTGECSDEPECDDSGGCEDDGDPCNGGVVCDRGRCVATPEPCPPGDSTACWRSTCRDGECLYELNHAFCDDGASCTTDRCDPEHPYRDARGCVNVPDDNVCGDPGDLRSCWRSVCVGAPALRFSGASATGCARVPYADACGGNPNDCNLGNAGQCRTRSSCASDAECMEGAGCLEERCIEGQCIPTERCHSDDCHVGWCPPDGSCVSVASASCLEGRLTP